MKNLVILLVFLAVSFNLNAQGFSWVQTPGGIGKQEATTVSVNSFGEIYVAGTFDEDFSIGDTVLSTVFGDQFYLAKFSASGQFEWVRTIVPEYLRKNSIISVVCDQAGNVCVSGKFNGEIELGSATLSTIGHSSTEDIFIARYNRNGEVDWVKQLGGMERDRPLGKMAIDQTDNLYFNWQFQGTVTVRGQQFHSTYSNGNNGNLLIKMDNQGDIIWAHQITPSGFTVSNLHNWSIHTDPVVGPNGNIVIAGEFSGQLKLGNLVKISTRQYAFYVAEFSPAGNLVSYSQNDSNIYQGPLEMAIDAQNNRYINLHNQANSFRLCKMNPQGQVVWSHATEGRNSNLEIGVDGNLYLTNIMGANPATTPPSVSVGNTILSSIDPQGNYVSHFNFGPNEFSAWIREMVQTPAGHFILVGSQVGSATIHNLTSPGSGGVVDALILKFLRNGNEITGTVYYDLNQNGIHDPQEPPAVGSLVVTEPGSSMDFARSDGSYYLFVDQGNWQLKVKPSSPYYTLNPAVANVSFSGSGQATNQDFGLWLIPGIEDLCITATSSRVRPGGVMRYTLTIFNPGSVTQPALVEFFYDPQLTFINSSVLPSQQTSNSLQWNLPPLAHGQTVTIVLDFSLPTTANLGDTLKAHYSVAGPGGDENRLNNFGDLLDIITGSFDPNDKRVEPAGAYTPAMKEAGQELTYTVRFQNTGTDTAYIVRILDTLDPHLDLATFRTLAGSHPFEINSPSPSVVEFIFANIMLPDSNVNELESHGFIKYSIKPKADFEIGQTISNTAHIFFDYNEAVVTNTVQSTFSLWNNFPFNTSPDDLSLWVFPNPISDQFIIEAKVDNPGDLSVTVSNSLGQLMYQKKQPGFSGYFVDAINTENWPAGIYMVSIHQKGKRRIGKKVLKLK